MGITIAKFQAKKNTEIVKVLKSIAKSIECGELDAEFGRLERGLEAGKWTLRVSIKETEKYGKSKQLSEI